MQGSFPVTISPLSRRYVPPSPSNANHHVRTTCVLCFLPPDLAKLRFCEIEMVKRKLVALFNLSRASITLEKEVRPPANMPHGCKVALKSRQLSIFTAYVQWKYTGKSM